MITLTALFSAVVIPVLNDGLLATVVEYTANDIALTALDTVLRYVIVIVRYLCIFVSYACAVSGLLHYGFKNFKTPSLLLIAGSFVRYIVASYGSFVFCYEHGLISYSASAVAAAGLNYVFSSVFDAVKNTVLVIITALFAAKVHDGRTKYVLPDEEDRPVGTGAFFRSAFSLSHPFLRICVFTACVEAVFECVLNFVSVTLSQIAADGLPETGLDYAALLSGYVLIIPLCALGAFAAVLLCMYHSTNKPHKKT